jgi:POT family proton-dependent oligopeptide transporter
MMGIWFLAASLGNLVAGLVAGKFSGNAVHQMSARYLLLVLATWGTGLVILLFARPIRRLAAGVN